MNVILTPIYINSFVLCFASYVYCSGVEEEAVVNWSKRDFSFPLTATDILS